ncbi:EcsC family protein [Cecembia rubra]|uniref:EcsC family protein n=1 Tax=Cecembia rubra TaxID=1485585 RepID=A0A2P8DW49_9BACT|nr:EcsC family protein [Cecembia rubra]PSL01431.1 EcsC family protein [Cecembia rubra]
MAYTEQYDEIALAELIAWLYKTKKKPSIVNKLTKGTQRAINDLIPERVHKVITFAIENMIKGVLFGTKYITPKPFAASNLSQREEKVRKIIKVYRRAASVEGAITGAGGLWLGLADFPAFLSIKMKMLFEIAAAYGHDVKKFQERLFMLYVFKLAFSSQETRNLTIEIIENWDGYLENLQIDEKEFDWRNFQLEYRDYMDLAKLAQLIPVIGAGVGAMANYSLSSTLGETAIQCYRSRYFCWDSNL